VYLIHVSNWTRVLNTRVQLLKLYLKKINILTRVFNTRVQLDTRIKYACPIVEILFNKKKLYLEKNNSLTRVFNTRVQLDTRIKYTCQIGHAYLIRVSNC
jgi:hypothetical protein